MNTLSCHVEALQQLNHFLSFCVCAPQATGADIGGGAMAGAATTENSEDPGKITYNLLLKNELLGAGVNRMLVCHNIGAIDPTHTHTHSHTWDFSPQWDTERNLLLSTRQRMCTHLDTFGQHTCSQRPLNCLQGHPTDEAVPGSPPSATRNMLRYKTSPTSGRGLASARDPGSPFALSSIGADSHKLLESPRKTPRRIPRVPFKVCLLRSLCSKCICACVETHLDIVSRDF